MYVKSITYQIFSSFLSWFYFKNIFGFKEVLEEEFVRVSFQNNEERKREVLDTVVEEERKKYYIEWQLGFLYKTKRLEPSWYA